jgi:hypothetical protein
MALNQVEEGLHILNFRWLTMRRTTNSAEGVSYTMVIRRVVAAVANEFANDMWPDQGQFEALKTERIVC